MRSSNLPPRDIFITYLLIIISILATYFMPHIIKSILFIVIVILFYSSNRDYIYLAFLFFIIDAPGGLFFSQTEDVIKISILNISFAEIFTLAALLKYSSMLREMKSFKFKKAYNIYFLFLLLLIIYGMFSGMRLTGTSGTGLGPYRRISKMIILLSLYLTLPIMLNEKWKIVRFTNLIFSFAIINFILQLLNIITGISVQEFFARNEFIGYGVNIRPVYGVFISFISLIMCLYFINEGSLKKKYLYLILIVSLLSIFVTATRGWMIACLFILVLYIITISKINILKYFKRLLPLAILLFVFLQVDVIKKQLAYSLERFSTLELIIEGDPTAGGTNVRLTKRSVPVMDKFYKKPVFGWGFSSIAFETYDPHVGNQSLLMSGGVIGYFVLLLSLALISQAILKCKSDLGKYYDEAKFMHIFVIAIGGLFIIHSSSTDLFGYMVPTFGYHVYKIVFLSVFFSIIMSLIQILYENFEKEHKYLDMSNSING